MNIVTFNGPITDQVLKESHIDVDVLKAPLFYIDEQTPGDRVPGISNYSIERMDWAEANPKFESVMLPFPLVRLCIKESGGGRERKLWIQQKSGRITFLDQASEQLYLIVFTEQMEDSYLVLPGARMIKWPDEKLDMLRLNALDVAFFGYYATSSANFISAVHPDKRGKSVQWVEARTHYVLLHKSHPANRKEVAKGDAVVEDTKYLRRQAHSRRAHFRILKSPRFSKKNGQKIPVKATWVGPKEWKQGSSVYRLVVP